MRDIDSKTWFIHAWLIFIFAYFICSNSCSYISSPAETTPLLSSSSFSFSSCNKFVLVKWYSCKYYLTRQLHYLLPPLSYLSFLSVLFSSSSKILSLMSNPSALVVPWLLSAINWSNQYCPLVSKDTFTIPHYNHHINLSYFSWFKGVSPFLPWLPLLDMQLHPPLHLLHNRIPSWIMWLRSFLTAKFDLSLLSYFLSAF